MKTFLHYFICSILVAPSVVLAGLTSVDVQTTSTAVIVKNLSSNEYMEVLINIGGCGKKVMAAPGKAVTVPFQNGRRDVEVKSVKLTQMSELLSEANANSKPVPQPVTDPKVITSMQPVCLDLK